MFIKVLLSIKNIAKTIFSLEISSKSVSLNEYESLAFGQVSRTFTTMQARKLARVGADFSQNFKGGQFVRKINNRKKIKSNDISVILVF